MKNEVISCRICKSKNVIKKGFRATENRGKIQRFYCRDCKKRFVIDDGFFRMRNNEHKITYCLDTYFRGMSLRKLQESLQIFYPHNCHYSTILRWIQKYAVMVGSFTDNLQIKGSKVVQVDEMEYLLRKKDIWFIDAIDPETRYIVSSGLYAKRSKEEIKEILYLAKKKDKEIFHITTDGFNVYTHTVRRVFFSSKRKYIHNVVAASKGQGFNHKIERLHNSIRERTKIMRNFHSLNSAKSLMKGYEIWYNFCRKHQAINCYPYELATDLQLGKNKWLDLIRLSCSSSFVCTNRLQEHTLAAPFHA